MIGGAVKGFLSGVKWQVLLWKVGVYVLVVGAVAALAYREGLSDCQIAALEKQTKEQSALIVQEREFVRESLAEMQAALTRRLATVDAQTKEGIKLRSELLNLQGELYAIMAKRAGNPSCAPSADELRIYDEIAARTRQ